MGVARWAVGELARARGVDLTECPGRSPAGRRPACASGARVFLRHSRPVIWSIDQDWRWEAFFAYDCPARCARRIRLVAYGARLESVLGASPRGFESPILRHQTPEPAQVPGFSLRLQRKVPIVGEGCCFNGSRVFPLVMEREGKNRGTKYEISTTRRGGRRGAFLLVLLVAPLVFRAPERTGELRDAEPGCGARGRWQGLAGLRGDAPSEARGADGSRAGRRPRAHQAARPHSKTLRRPPHRRRLSCCEHRSQALPPPAGSAAGPNNSCMSHASAADRRQS